MVPQAHDSLETAYNTAVDLVLDKNYTRKWVCDSVRQSTNISTLLQR
eukprot:IDg14612t1